MRFSFIIPFHAGLSSLATCLDALSPLLPDSELIIAADAPWVPLAHSQVAVAAHNNVQGLAIHPSAIIYYQSVWLGP